MKIYKSNNTKWHVPIACGIKLDEDRNPVFNYRWDDLDDILHLVRDTSGEFDKNGIKYVYAYQYNESASGNDKADVRKALKDTKNIFREDLEDFVETGVLRFDRYNKLEDFSCVAYVEPTKVLSLINVMKGYVYSYISVPPMDVSFIKQTYQEVQFDEAAARREYKKHNYKDKDIDTEIDFINRKFNGLKESGQLFEMKRVVPSFIRSAFSNFLKFKSKEMEDAYRRMESGKVLLFDDFITTGRTIEEAIRCLKSVNPDNEITVFVLIKQH